MTAVIVAKPGRLSFCRTRIGTTAACPGVRLLCAAVFLTFVAAADLWASDVDGLYEARTPVGDRSDAEFARGAVQAFGVVLAKLTGVGNVARNPALRELRQQAKRLIQQFGYEQAATESGEQRKNLFLRVEFDARAVNMELRQRGLVVWGKERPDTLIWLIIDDQRGRHAVDAAEPDRFSKTLLASAQARGIPILLPLLDIEDTARLAHPGTWSALSQAVVDGSARYHTESILVGHLRQVQPAIWEAQWQLTLGGESLSWDQQGDIPDLMIEEAVGLLADALGRRFAVPVLYAHEGEVGLVVHGVRSIEDYARVQTYLASLDAVSALSVSRVAEQTVTFRLTTHGDGDTLAQSIAFGNVLAPTGNAESDYQLVPH